MNDDLILCHAISTAKVAKDAKSAKEKHSLLCVLGDLCALGGKSSMDQHTS